MKNDTVNRRKKVHLPTGKQNGIFQNDSKHKLSLPIGRSNLHSDHLYGAVWLYTLLFDKKWLLTTGTHQRTECMYNARDVSDIQSTFLKNVHFLSMVSRHNFSLFNTSASQSGLFYELYFATSLMFILIMWKAAFIKIDGFGPQILVCFLLCIKIHSLLAIRKT